MRNRNRLILARTVLAVGIGRITVASENLVFLLCLFDGDPVVRAAVRGGFICTRTSLHGSFRTGIADLLARLGISGAPIVVVAWKAVGGIPDDERVAVVLGSVQSRGR